MPRAVVLSYNVATLLRVGGGALVPEGAYPASVAIAGATWAVAFGLYAVRYAPVLTRPRADGKPG